MKKYPPILKKIPPQSKKKILLFNEKKEVELNRIFRELDTFKFMKNPEISPKLEADAQQIRWICTTGCPKETYGNFVLNRKTLDLKSATEKFNCRCCN